MKKTIIAIAAVLATASAQAQWAVVDSAAYRGLTAVVDAIRGQGQASTALQAKAAEQISASIASAQAEAAIDRLTTEFRHPDACSAVAATAGGGEIARTAPPAAAGGGRRGGYVPRGSPANIKRDSPVHKVLEIAEGSAPAEAVEVQTALAVSAGCSVFAGAGTQRGRDCRAAGIDPAAQARLVADADIKAATLLEGPQPAGEPARRRLTVDTADTSASWLAVRAYRRNLASPVEWRQLTEREAKTEAGRRFLTVRDSYEARMSLADAPIQNLTSNRAAHLDTLNPLKELLASQVSGDYTRGYLARNVPDWQRTGISRDELIQLDIERRSNNLAWHANLAGLPGSPVEKEIALMMSADQHIRWRQAQTLERIEVLLGQLVASSTRGEMVQTLNALHQQATR